MRSSFAWVVRQQLHWTVGGILAAVLTCGGIVLWHRHSTAATRPARPVMVVGKPVPLSQIGKGKVGIVPGVFWPQQSKETNPTNPEVRVSYASLEKTLPDLLRGHDYTWCHLVASGFQPVFIDGIGNEILAQLNSGSIAFRRLAKPSNGVVTGMAYRPVSNRAQMQAWPAGLSLPIVFTDAQGTQITCETDRYGKYSAFLPPGEYNLNCRGTKQGFHIRAGQTTVIDVAIDGLLYID